MIRVVCRSVCLSVCHTRISPVESCCGARCVQVAALTATPERQLQQLCAVHAAELSVSKQAELKSKVSTQEVMA